MCKVRGCNLADYSNVFGGFVSYEAPNDVYSWLLYYILKANSSQNHKWLWQFQVDLILFMFIRILIY